LENRDFYMILDCDFFDFFDFEGGTCFRVDLEDLNITFNNDN